MWDYRSTDDVDEDWRDQVVTRHCFDCKADVRVSINEPYQNHVWCEDCLRKPARSQARASVPNKTGAA